MARNKKKIIRACTVSLSIDFFDDVMRLLRNDGYEMVVLTSPGPELYRLQEEGFHCIEVKMERRISPIKDLLALIRLVQVLFKEKPYMIHSMTPKAGLLCMLAGWLTRVPIRIHMFTGLVWPTSTGFKRNILMAADWLTCVCATHVLPEGQGVLNDLKNNGITKKPLKVLGYGNVKGVDMKYFDPNRFAVINKDKSHFTFIFVGRIVGDKGVNELVEAFTMLHENYPHIRLVLVGNYEDDLDPLQPITHERIKTNPAIDAVGPKYGDDLLVEYMKADCHILPSYREGFPNTPLEAGALGLPNIVTDINGSREIVVDGVNGLIVPPHVVQPLYDAMKRMVTDNSMCEKMKTNARLLIEQRFERSFVQGCLVDFYKKIIND